MQAIYVTIVILFCIGFYTVLAKNHLIKMIIGINILESAIILLLVAISYKPEGTAPILDANYEVVVDPIPQALALTAIVIGASTTALMLAFSIKIYNRYGTLEIDEINHLKG